MKKILLLTLTILLFLSGPAQEKDISEQIKGLQIKSSPAFVILGVEPENIQRPNSPSDFVAGVQSAIVNDRLQPNFAMETSPYYWGKKNPRANKFNVADYIFSNNYGQNLLRSITLSFATSESDSVTFGKIPTGTGLGLGFHLQLFQGRVSKNTRNNLLDWYEANYKVLNLYSILFALENNGSIDNLDLWLDQTMGKGNNKSIPEGEKVVIKSILMRRLKKNSLTAADAGMVQKLIDTLSAKSEASLHLVNQYKYPLTREGFMMELAVANASVAAESKWDKLQSAKTAIWITPSYRFNVNKDPEISDFIDLMAVIRVTFNSKDVDTSNYVDIGGKLQWIHNRLSFSGEAIYRYLSKKPADQLKKHTFRTAFTLSYKMNELVTFQATFGSNFNGNSTTYSDPKKMFAVGGFNFGFSNFFKKQ